MGIFDKLFKKGPNRMSATPDQIKKVQEFVKKYNWPIEVTGELDYQTKFNIAEMYAFLQTQFKVEDAAASIECEHPQPMMARMLKCGLILRGYDLPIDGKVDDAVRNAIEDFAGSRVITNPVFDELCYANIDEEEAPKDDVEVADVEVAETEIAEDEASEAGDE